MIDTYGVDVEVEREAVRWLLAKAAELGTDAAIVVPGVGNIKSLGRVVGREHAAYAEKHRELVIDGVRVHIYTPRTQPSSFEGPVLVPWATTHAVEDAERLSPPAICATGWSEDGLDDWKRSWAPTDPRTGEADVVADQAPAAVRGAVASLSGVLGNDVIHPMDKKRAINAFKALYTVGVPIDSVLVRSLAISAGWEPDAADRLADIARKVREGRTPKGGDRLARAEAKQMVERFESE